jgi:hypothetical protein
MLTNHHLFHAVFVGDGNLYLEVGVIDNMAIRHPSQVGLSLGTWAFKLTSEPNHRIEAVSDRLSRNEKLMVNTTINRKELLGLAENLVKSIERDYGFRFLRGEHAGYLRQTVFALGEYKLAAFNKLPGECDPEMFRTLNAYFRYQLAPQRA